MDIFDSQFPQNKNERKKHMKTKTHIIYPAFALFALACFAFVQSAQAVSPAPDGGYPGGNTAEGQNALFSLTTGSYNTGVGFLSLTSDTSGVFNTAIGAAALLLNTTGPSNTATGAGALLSNANGANNTANGAFALFSNTTAFSNTATGYQALSSNTTGFQNTANGDSALYNNTTGARNIALGVQAGFSLDTGDDNIDIGSTGVAGESRTIRIGEGGNQTATFITGISGATVASGVTVIIDIDGHLGTIASSQRFKAEIKPMDKRSEAIFALKPVTFHYKRDLDPKCIPQFGLVAEDVEKVNPDLVVRDAEGKVYTVRYEAVNAMLLNEFLKEHRKVEDLKKDFQATVAQQQKQIEALTAQIQKVSAQIEMSKFAPQVVLSNQ
jgi:Chaperone of endosialidase